MQHQGTQQSWNRGGENSGGYVERVQGYIVVRGEAMRIKGETPDFSTMAV